MRLARPEVRARCRSADARRGRRRRRCRPSTWSASSPVRRKTLRLADLDPPARVGDRGPLARSRSVVSGSSRVVVGQRPHLQERRHRANQAVLGEASRRGHEAAVISPVASSTSSVSAGRRMRGIRADVPGRRSRRSCPSGCGAAPNRAMASGGRIRSSRIMAWHRPAPGTAMQLLDLAALDLVRLRQRGQVVRPSPDGPAARNVGDQPAEASSRSRCTPPAIGLARAAAPACTASGRAARARARPARRRPTGSRDQQPGDRPQVVHLGEACGGSAARAATASSRRSGRRPARRRARGSISSLR